MDDGSTTLIPGGAMLGMLGGGQLGRMFVDAAHALGYRVHVLCPEADCPAAQVADAFTCKAYDDLPAVDAFARSVAVVTYEFENVPARTAAACARHVPVRPGGHVLEVAQDRIREKTTLREHGIPVGPFMAVGSAAALREAVEKLGCPAVLKTASGGYDGKGQRILRSPADVTYAWAELGPRPCILEAFVDFQQEVSVVAARGLDGQVRCFGPIANTHRDHILDVSVVPSGAPAEAEREALSLAERVMNHLEVVGVLCVEFFQTRPPSEVSQVQSGTVSASAGCMLVNELAPRPHNSGHLTLDAYSVSQFEQQVRAVCGLPLAEVHLKHPGAMVNLLGDLWPESGLPPWDEIAKQDGLHLHLYGKTQARRGRKMAHLTALARTPHEAIRNAVEARARLAPDSAIAPD